MASKMINPQVNSCEPRCLLSGIPINTPMPPVVYSLIDILTPHLTPDAPAYNDNNIQMLPGTGLHGGDGVNPGNPIQITPPSPLPIPISPPLDLNTGMIGIPVDPFMPISPLSPSFQPPP